ncbi:lectin-like domain-containing protein [Flaviramulus aquimarinus]
MTSATQVFGQLNATTIGSAVNQGSNCFIITPNELNQSGGIWFNNPIDFSEDFTIYYQNNFGTNDVNGADGMALVFKRNSNPEIGGVGGGLGFQGISPSLIVEFDTWQNIVNADPTWDHISIIRDGNSNHSSTFNSLVGPIQASATSTNIEDGVDHEIKIQWNALAQTFNVFFDCVLRASLTSDIKNTIFSGDNDVFFGFVGSTGGSSNLHQLCFNSITFVENLTLQNETICLGETVSLDATVPSGASYSWSPTAGVSDPNIANPTFTPSTTTDYTVTINDACGETTTEEVTITVEPIALPSFTTVGPICSGESLAALTTTSNEGIVGTWSPAVNNTTTTTYTFTPNAGECAMPQTMTIIVNPITTPTFIQVPAICSGNTLAALPTTSNEGITGIWSPALDNTMTTTYTFTPNSGQCAVGQSMTITVNPITTPTFTQVPAICNGDTLAALPTTSNEGITGTWSPALDNTMTTTYTFTPNPGQCTVGQSMTITVNPITTPTFAQVPAICNGDTLAALPTTSNEGITGIWSPLLDNTMTTTYTFTPNSGQCALGQSMTITVNPITTPTFAQVPAICNGDTLAALPTISNEGVMGSWTPALDNTTTTVYTFTPSSGQCVIEQTMTITVNPITTPTFTQVPAICNGDTLAVLPTTSNEGITGSWSPVLDNTMTTTYTFTPSSGQCAVEQIMTITVNPITTPTFTQVPAICNGDTLAELPTTSNEGITGIWSPALDNTMTTTYTFTPNSGQCAVGQSMTITVNPITTPTFTQVPAICNGDTLAALPTISNEGVMGSWSPTLDNTTTTVYTFTPSSGLCVIEQTMTITVNPIIIPTFNQVAAICSGDTLTALPTTSNEGITGTWNPALDNTITTTYTFTPSIGQCATVQTMTITVNPNQAPIFSQILPVCIGDMLAPLPTVSDNGVPGTWSPALNNMATTTYTFTPDPGFCPSPVSLTIEVFGDPDFTLENEYFLCFDTNSVIILPTTIDTGLNTPIYNFTWLLNSVPIVGANQGSYMPVEGGEYEVIVQNAMTMCESSLLATVTVLTEPEFEAEVTTDPFSENQIIQVTTISIGDFEYQLDAGPWQDESIFNNVSIGEHIVTVRDKRGCIESSRTVFVIGYPKYFTPNGDGYNETWNIVAPTSPINFLASAKIYIFDRYGKLLKQIDPTGEGWNGIYNGSNMSSDDYWFVVEYTDPNSLLRKEFKAHFALKR